MRIKIKNPHAAPINKEIWFTGIASLIALSYFSVYVATVDLSCKNQSLILDSGHHHLTCLLNFIFPLSLPLICMSAFIWALWLKYTKFRSPRPGTCFTYMTFAPDGVLLEKPNPAQNVFFPYTETSLRVTIHVQRYFTRGRSWVRFENIVFTFTRQDGPHQKIQLFPPRNAMPFLCKILDKRALFHQFSYRTSSRSNRLEAQNVLKKMDTYCEKGFMPIFDSKYERNIYLFLGMLTAAAAVWTFFSFAFLVFFVLSVWFLGRPLKEMYLEYRTRKK